MVKVREDRKKEKASGSYLRVVMTPKEIYLHKYFQIFSKLFQKIGLGGLLSPATLGHHLYFLPPLLSLHSLKVSPNS